MRKTNLKWVLLAALILVMSPLGARERTGILAPADVKKEQDEIMKTLTEGNKKFVKHHVYKGGFPKVMILSCADSRVPPETIFNLDTGQAYVIRAFGNVVDKAILASLEYGANNIGCRVLIVLGHTRCTAIDEAIKESNHHLIEWRSLNMKDLIQRILPAVTEAKKSDRITKIRTGEGLEEDALHDAVRRINIHNSILAIRRQSVDLWKLEETDMLKIVGAIYDLDTGKVEWLK
jgi:carbonic anhydrase